MKKMPLTPCCGWRSIKECHCANGPRQWCSRPNSPNLGRNGDSMTEARRSTQDVLDAYRQEAGLSHGELWLRYFELGGMSTGFELEAFLYGVLAPNDHDHDV